ncbi:MAG: hypothetical protein COV72_05830 [Candidatus Omnitrophica bacterium CG11_big_fil_rev_8_21_14_0_20_42_13]|uniref:Radical SAM protein n=1 Tax=Candidatus Ghiorseimicrobium undicola TaxID=1974746 RepID=A0A2H0LWQ0_9BACT|nr:MAG: hypothetical protein COV72_05830 [Candidatus Omnitrophica bacterium CG11_big_fil_rev_8_21_14_0_20_42_13]
MNAFLSTMEKYDLDYSSLLRRDKLATLQVNMGNLCNQSCLHCHVGASPGGAKIMPRKIVDDVLSFLSRHKIKTLDITGGAPELNPNFDYFVASARPLADEVIVRSNLTVLFEEGKKHLPDFFKKYRVHLICSLPCYLKENIDYQRGEGVFDKSIAALQVLNKAGFALEKGLSLDLVYNPKGAYLPPEQEKLEKDYKHMLRGKYGIEFSRLITITNVPINRFKDYLNLNGEYENYFKLLKESFNPKVLDNIMCRSFLSVGFDGKIYDCDFNQALGLTLKDDTGKQLTIDRLDPASLEGKEIIIDEHCLSCAAGSGSSCQGAIEKSEEGVYSKIKKYYGQLLKSTKDLKTSACCLGDSLPKQHKEIISMIDPEIVSKFYGCGSPIPPLLEGKTILDLGCGSGRDVYLASFLAGEEGKVIGVDMTDEQIDTAKKYQKKQADKFGFKKVNTEFKKGYIENLAAIDIRDNSMDVVISNCVINLSPDKEKVFSEIFRVLKPGGELYFSDVFSSARLREELKNDSVIYGECLGGALYIEDFRRLLSKVGCPDYRVVSKRKLDINNEEIKSRTGIIDFYSVTIRAFKLQDLEDICEDYGQTAVYLGTIDGYPHKFELDSRHIFVTGKPMLVCGNTASMLSNTRHNKHFKVTGDRRIHYGQFTCVPSDSPLDSTAGSCC